MLPVNDTHAAVRNKSLKQEASHLAFSSTMEGERMLPRILRDLKTNKVYLTKKEAENMGLKYHLGHTGHVWSGPTSSNEKIFLTKSSI